MTNHTDQIIKASLVVSNMLGDALDRWGDNMEQSEEIYDAMDALWYAIEAYKVATAHGKLVANG